MVEVTYNYFGIFVTVILIVCALYFAGKYIRKNNKELCDRINEIKMKIKKRK